MTKKKLFIAIILVLVALSAVVVISERKTHFVTKFFDSVIADNINHYLSCDQLPTVEEVTKAVQAHKDVMEKIVKEIGSRYRDGDIKVTWEIKDSSGMALEGDKDGSYFGVYWGEAPSCQNTGKGDILFDYLSHSDREIIEKILGTNFFGIPYRGENH